MLCRSIEEAKAQARKDVEDRLRKLGIDAGDAGTPASDSSRKLKVELDDLDESLLYQGEINSPARKKAMQEYDKKLSELRRKLISQ